MTIMWIGISWHNGFERMINQDMMATISQIRIDETIIDGMIVTTIIEGKMTGKMIQEG